jgi:hypothetical protein
MQVMFVSNDGYRAGINLEFVTDVIYSRFDEPSGRSRERSVSISHQHAYTTWSTTTRARRAGRLQPVHDAIAALTP